MKIEILEGCYVEGEAKKAGDVVETSKANLLIGMGKAKPYIEKKKKAKVNRAVTNYETRKDS